MSKLNLRRHGTIALCSITMTFSALAANSPEAEIVSAFGANMTRAATAGLSYPPRDLNNIENCVHAMHEASTGLGAAMVSLVFEAMAANEVGNYHLQPALPRYSEEQRIGAGQRLMMFSKYCPRHYPGERSALEARPDIIAHRQAIARRDGLMFHSALNFTAAMQTHARSGKSVNAAFCAATQQYQDSLMNIANLTQNADFAEIFSLYALRRHTLCPA
jgi:hypothetical protein